LLRGQRYTSAKISAAEFSPAGPPFSAVEDFRAATRFPAAEDFWFPAQHFLFPTQSLSATGDWIDSFWVRAAAAGVTEFEFFHSLSCFCGWFSVTHAKYSVKYL
jgi:hypothetical protein